MRVIRSVSSVENRFPPTVLPRWQTDNEFRKLKLLASFEKIIPLKYPSDLQSSSTLTSKLLTRSHLPSYGLVTFLSTSEIFLQIRASNTEMLTSSRWVVVVR